MVLRFAAAALLLLLGTGPVTAQQARRAPATNWVNVVAKTPEGGFRQGNPNAPIKLVEYGSRTCPTCGHFAAEGVEPLRREWIASGKLSYEFRDFLIHGVPDLSLALLNQCVPTARFFPVLDQIFANQKAFDEPLHKLIDTQPKTVEAWQQLPPAQAATKFAEALGMLSFMNARGLPEAQARRCLANPALIKGIAGVNAGGANAGVQGTPSFFVNGRRVRAFTWDQLQPELRAADS
ncbi:protein-disulfide isomerase [Sphingomonas naasensis]|uniref:Protein-disulfide isomerase n=1 Tax=Sphingomonas naasensis TaxID=1344951 RepID=A0A4S1WIN4_9SPHN|nr:thioredoxin domain-containing protein [Sphingomonas naasensis]NIJ21391.1 protein-disulfide isomerase [Sphingomonas naasensis]TGX41647.1 protein-disulfide isomerase [Sphingomonas naasensis]